VAVVNRDEQIAAQRVADCHPVAWIHARRCLPEPLAYSGRDHDRPQAVRDAGAALLKAAGITIPIDEIDAANLCAFFPGSSRCGWRTSGLVPEARAGTHRGRETAIGGRLPCECLERSAVFEPYWPSVPYPIRPEAAFSDGR